MLKASLGENVAGGNKLSRSEVFVVKQDADRST